ncbi:MAG: acyl-CoA thioesterase [Alphaproteobacteria bacterium]
MSSNEPYPDFAAPPAELKGRNSTIRLIAMPADANPSGDIFGGWILAHMDLAGGAHAFKHLNHRVVTVGIEAMSFHKPVFIGDDVAFYTKIFRTGRTSVTIKIESWAYRRNGEGYVKVTEGLFTYVQIDDNRVPIPISA